jgi:hypothetical protein
MNTTAGGGKCHTDAERNGVQNLRDSNINNQEGGAGIGGGDNKAHLDLWS